MRYILIALLLVVATSMAWAVDTWPPTPGQTGSLVVHSANSQDGAPASLWGFYNGTSGWVSYTFGAGTFSGGSATINYTVPANFVSDFYWNAVANYSATSDERGQYCDDLGGWDQFFTSDPNGTSVTTTVYQFDQRKVTTRSASFRASVQGGTVFPDATLVEDATVSVRTPWTGTMAQFTAAEGGYYSYSKTSLLPTRAAAKGFTVDVLEGDPLATQQFQKIRLHKGAYSVELFGYKNLSSDDPMGYLWWVTLVDVQSADCLYNGTTGVFSGNFATPLPTGVMYFVVPEFDVLDAVGSTTATWVQAGRGTDLLMTGSSFEANLLALDATEGSLYVKPGQTVTVDMNVSNLTQEVYACQAMLGYSSTYFNNPTTAGCVVAGGGVWNELIYDSWTVGSGITGQIDTAVGVKAEGGLATIADGKVAIITLTAKATDGATQIEFRQNMDPDPGLTKSTFLSDMDAQTVWPAKQNSQTIVIDGTAPDAFAVTPSTTCTKGAVTLTFETDDNLSGIDYYELLVDGVSQGNVTSPHALDLSSYDDGPHFIVVRAFDKSGNFKDSAPVTVNVDNAAPVITSITATQNTGSVLFPAVAVQGVVDIYVTVTDPSCADLVTPPSVVVDGFGAAGYIDVTDDTYHYQVTVLATTTNGSHTITVTAVDTLGNSTTDNGSAIGVDKNQITGQIELQGFGTASRVVTFVATGGVQKTWNETLSFTSGVAIYRLNNVPIGTTGLSAKTAWSLRNKLAMALDGDNQAAVNFTGAEKLLGGDINNSNSINVLDYSKMKISWSVNADGDVNGDGFTGTLDYSIMKSNWFKVGDAQ